MPANFVIPSIFTAVDRFSAPVRAMGTSVQNFAAKSTAALSFVERGFRKLMSPLVALNRMMMGVGLYVGLFTFIHLFQGAIKLMADFQQLQVNISTVSKATQSENMKLAASARQVALQYGTSAAKVSELQFQLLKLGNTSTDVLNMATPITSGSVALGTTPEKAADLVGGVMKGLGDDSSMTAKRMSQIAYAADQTAADFESMATQLPIVTSIAAMEKIPFSKILAYLGTLRNYQVHTATGSTSLKNIILDLLKKGKDINQGLKDIANAPNSVIYALDKHNKKSVVTGVILSRELENIEKLALSIENISPQFVDELALKRLNTFHGAMNLARAAYGEFILSIDDGTGKYAAALTHIARVSAGILLLSSDSDQAREAFARLSPEVQAASEKYLGWLKVIKWIIISMLALKAIIIAWNIIVGVGTGLLVAYNIAWGIYNALTKTAVIYTGAQTAAMYAQIVATKILAAATWVLSGAMLANPIVLVIAAVLILIGYVYSVTKRFNEWGAVLAYIFPMFGLLINLVQSFRRNWEMIGDAFSGQGILSGLKAIAFTIHDALLMPLQQVFQIISNLTGFKWAEDAAKGIQAFRDNLGLNVTTDESGEILPAQRINRDNEILKHQYEESQKLKMTLDINDPTNRTSIRTQGNIPSFIDIRTTSTMTPN